jgi:hypothetical protein
MNVHCLAKNVEPEKKSLDDGRSAPPSSHSHLP